MRRYLCCAPVKYFGIHELDGSVCICRASCTTPWALWKHLHPWAGNWPTHNNRPRACYWDLDVGFMDSHKVGYSASWINSTTTYNARAHAVSKFSRSQSKKNNADGKRQAHAHARPSETRAWLTSSEMVVHPSEWTPDADVRSGLVSSRLVGINLPPMTRWNLTWADMQLG